MKPPYAIDVGTGLSIEGCVYPRKDKLHTCKYRWQSVTASENSPDQVFRGELSMSSLILHIPRRISSKSANFVLFISDLLESLFGTPTRLTCKLLQGGDSIHQAVHSTHLPPQNTAMSHITPARFRHAPDTDVLVLA